MKTSKIKRVGHSRDRWENAKLHREKVAKKQERIDGLKDLLDTYELREKTVGLSTTEHESLLLARAHLRNARSQKAAYKPIFGE